MNQELILNYALKGMEEEIRGIELEILRGQQLILEKQKGNKTGSKKSIEELKEAVKMLGAKLKRLSIQYDNFNTCVDLDLYKVEYTGE